MSPRDVEAIKHELADGKVLPFGTAIYAAFANVTSSVYSQQSQSLSATMRCFS